MTNSKEIYWSIIMPAYNVEKYISTALDSVVNQSVPQEFWEIIVIDDSSTDKTSEIVRRYQKKYNNIKLLENKNNGPRWQSICWEEGLREANGFYLGFLDADDYLYPNALEEMSRYYIQNSRPDQDDYDTVICAWSQNERWDHKLKHKHSNGLSEDPYKHGSLIDGMLSKPGVVVSHFLTCIRAYLLDIGGFDTSIKTSADRWLALKMDLHGRLGFLDKIIHKYRFLRPGSVTVERRQEQVKYLASVLNSALKERNDNRIIEFIMNSDNFSYQIRISNRLKSSNILL